MRREELVDLSAFATVAEEESFTRAAAKLGTSQSALSHTVRRLETRLGVRLLTRTTRRVAPTQAGERLLKVLGPALGTIAAELASLSKLREKPAGTIRITTSEHAANSVLWPALERLLPDYPDIHVELSIDSGLTDIVAERFDAGVRLGESGHGKDSCGIVTRRPLRAWSDVASGARPEARRAAAPAAG
jgi:DNA-binding transcriptional LysR family regulator